MHHGVPPILVKWLLYIPESSSAIQESTLNKSEQGIFPWPLLPLPLRFGSFWQTCDVDPAILQSIPEPSIHRQAGPTVEHLSARDVRIYGQREPFPVVDEEFVGLVVQNLLSGHSSQ